MDDKVEIMKPVDLGGYSEALLALRLGVDVPTYADGTPMPIEVWKRRLIPVELRPTRR